MHWRRAVLLAGLLLAGGLLRPSCSPPIIGAEVAQGADKPKRLLLLGQGPDGHPPTTHEYMAGVRLLAKCLEPVAGLKVTVVRADEPWTEGPELLAQADGVVLFLSEGAKWVHNDPQRLKALQELVARGGGIVGLHWAIGTREANYIDNYLKLVGGCHGGPDRRYKVLEERVQVAARHPITFGIEDFRVKDEFYYHLKFVTAPSVSRSKRADSNETALRPILRVPIDGEPQTVAWAWERPDGGRSFGFSGLHFHDNWRLEAYRRLVTQAVLWTLKLPVPEQGLAVDVPEEALKLQESGSH